MSLELRDFRGKITHETHAALDALARAHGKEMQDIVREVLHDWALRQIRAASLLTAVAKREGFDGEREGVDSR